MEKVVCAFKMEINTMVPFLWVELKVTECTFLLSGKSTIKKMVVKSFKEVSNIKETG